MPFSRLCRSPSSLLPLPQPLYSHRSSVISPFCRWPLTPPPSLRQRLRSSTEIYQLYSENRDCLNVKGQGQNVNVLLFCAVEAHNSRTHKVKFKTDVCYIQVSCRGAGSGGTCAIPQLMWLRGGIASGVHPPKTNDAYSPFPPHSLVGPLNLARGLGEPVREELGRQTIFTAFWAEMSSGESNFKGTFTKNMQTPSRRHWSVSSNRDTPSLCYIFCSWDIALTTKQTRNRTSRSINQSIVFRVA